MYVWVSESVCVCVGVLGGGLGLGLSWARRAFIKLYLSMVGILFVVLLVSVSCSWFSGQSLRGRSYCLLLRGFSVQSTLPSGTWNLFWIDYPSFNFGFYVFLKLPGCYVAKLKETAFEMISLVFFIFSLKVSLSDTMNYLMTLFITSHTNRRAKWKEMGNVARSRQNDNRENFEVTAR